MLGKTLQRTSIPSSGSRNRPTGLYADFYLQYDLETQDYVRLCTVCSFDNRFLVSLSVSRRAKGLFVIKSYISSFVVYGVKNIHTCMVFFLFQTHGRKSFQLQTQKSVHEPHKTDTAVSTPWITLLIAWFNVQILD